MKPEYIGIGNFDTYNYVYTYCNCRLPVDYAIKWPLIKDGKPHSYTCTCEDCGTTVSVIAKSYGPEVYKEMEMTECRKYKKAFEVACELLNGSILYGYDSDRIFSEMMDKDGVVSSFSYEEFILNNLDRLTGAENKE